MKSPLYNYKNRFIFLNIWKTTAVEALGFFRPRALGAYWTAVALNECLRLAPVLFVFTLIHLPVGVLLLWLLMTLFPASNDFSEPLMKGLGISAQKHSVPFVLSLSKSTKQNTKHTHARVWRIIISDLLLTFLFHVHLGLLHPAPLLPFTVFTLWHGLQAVQGRSERRGLGIDLFFLPPFLYQKKGPQRQRRLHLNTEHKDRSRGIFYFLISLLPACWVRIQTAWAQICMAKGVIMCCSPAAHSFNFTGFYWKNWPLLIT